MRGSCAVKPKVLIAESSFYVAGVYAKELTKRGYQTITCTTADQMVHAYEGHVEFHTSLHDPFFAVIVDEHLPPCGDSAIQKILSITPSQKILYLTEFRPLISSIKHDAVEIIEKPFSMTFLVNKLEELGAYN
jgi:DNA-binding response OmpR family regulator